MANSRNPEERFLYHCIIQSPVEPLTTYELALTGPDQSQGQLGLTEAVHKAFMHFSGMLLTHLDHLCYVAFAVHPDGSEHWEACKRCNELIGHEHENSMQYSFTEGPTEIKVYHQGEDDREPVEVTR